MAGVAFINITPKDLQDPQLTVLNQLLGSLIAAVNQLSGVAGTVPSNADIDMQGNSIEDVGGITPKNTLVVTGSKGGNAALTSLLTSLARLGLIQDKSS